MKKCNLMLPILLLISNINVQAQSTIDEDLIKALNYSNISYDLSGFSKDVKTIIALIYGQRNIEYQKYLLGITVKSIDQEIILDSIRDSIEEFSSTDFLHAYNSFHETEYYSLIQQLERREISPEERKLYIYAYETEERKQIYSRLVDCFDVSSYKYVYFESIITLVINLDEVKSSSEKAKLLSYLKNYVRDQLFFPGSRESLLDYYSVCYHELDTLKLKEYVDFFVSDDLLDFYKAIYNGLRTGIIRSSETASKTET